MREKDSKIKNKITFFSTYIVKYTENKNITFPTPILINYEPMFAIRIAKIKNEINLQSKRKQKCINKNI